MGDHFALMAGRLLTESTLQATIHEASTSSSNAALHHHHQHEADASVLHEAEEDGSRPKTGVIVECRICQEEGDEASMDNPCSCKGSLKYAHYKCIQRWCDEKGDTECEICLEQFTPNYTAPAKLFQHGRTPSTFRRNRERQEALNPGYVQAHNVPSTDQTVTTSTSYDQQSSNPRSIIFCRIIAITLMALLVLRDVLSVILGGPEVHSFSLVTLLLFRTAGIVIPIYIILVSITSLLRSCNPQQVMPATSVSEPRGTDSSQAMPPQQHVISIQ